MMQGENNRNKLSSQLQKKHSIDRNKPMPRKRIRDMIIENKKEITIRAKRREIYKGKRSIIERNNKEHKIIDRLVQ
jgi:hypothetical protein